MISVSLILMLNLGGLVYADESIPNDVTSIITTGSTSNTTTSKKEMTIGISSKYEIIVQNDDAFTGLDSFMENYTLPEMSAETKQLLFKSLTSLVVSVITGDGSYTLETFKTAFIEICTSYGIDITEDFMENLDKYISKYLDDEFESNETNVMLNSIYVSLGFIIILLIALWQGGGSFR